MTTHLISGGPIALPTGIVDDHTVIITDDTIEAVVPAHDPRAVDAADRAGATTHDLGGQLLTPGLIDLHIHGGFGAGFEDAERAGTALEGLLGQGVTSVMTSLASAPIDTMLATSHALVEQSGRPGQSRVLGVHLEGPYIAVDQCGAHDPQFLRSPDQRSIDRIAELAGTVTMVTLAPELDNALAATKAWADAGIIVAAGHSSAHAEDLDPCVDAGLSHATHLWSGMGTTIRRGPYRVPGLLEESLASSTLTCEVIADGRHLPPQLLEVARRCVGDRLIAVSDGTIGIGLPEGTRYQLSTIEAVVDDGVGKVVGQDAFAGSTTALSSMLAHLHRDLGWPLEDVLAMMTSRPAAIAGRADSLGSVAAGHLADLVVWDSALAPVATMQAGRWVGAAAH
ncbi:MAG TPA: amidohydrolase family protein [Candidatus Avipropionibacterium avicola]|uniref:Amidohydrolase family protein n=1 Tax=Candidatus Avipropionibacterium avicola TaxID=2840701 RepID=A0A9D1KM95_9ACTN|nr:amidohydrolase family protein [Candidatus Avipropionibacterium avicola]